MKPSLHSLDHQTTLRFTDRIDENEPLQSGWVKSLQALGQCLVNCLFEDKDLQVWQTIDQQGITQWHAYDPRDRSDIHGLSEAEMREWIECRYHQRPGQS